MIPADTGKVNHVNLTYGSIKGDTKANYFEVMKTYISKMPSARFTILASKEEEKKELESYINKLAEAKEISNPDRVQVLHNKGYSYSIWAQDSTLVSGNKIISQSRDYYPGFNDGAVAMNLEKSCPGTRI